MMNRTINRWLVVMGGLTLIFGAVTWLLRDSRGNASYYTGSNSVAVCDTIEVNLLKCGVELIPYDGSEIKFQYTSVVPITVMKGDNRLVISESDEFRLSFFMQETEQLGLKLYLPENLYESITVYTSSGAVTANGVSAEKLNVATKSGELDIGGCTGEVKLTNGTGFTHFTLSEITAGSGVESKSGDVLITLPRGASVALSYETESGEFESDMISGSVEGSFMYSFNGGESLIYADVAAGTLTVEERERA